MTRHANASIWACIAAGLIGYVALPWYAIQDTSWYEALPQVFEQAEGANGVIQAALQGRSWLFIGLVGLAVCALGGLLRAGRAQGGLLLVGGAVGAVGLALTGFLIGARGWSFALLNTHLGELPFNQFGIGAGGAVALA